MKVQVRLFAVARQIAGRDAVQVELTPGATIADLRRALANQIPQLSGLLPHMMFAAGAQYVSNNAILSPETDVACIPPVSGG